MTRLAAIDRLRSRLSHLSLDNRFLNPGNTLRLGLPAIDRILPGHGLDCGGLHDITGDYSAITIFLAALAARDPRRQAVLWITPDHQPSASALAQQGLDHRRLTIAWTRRHADRLWAMDDSLRSLGYGAVIGEFAAAGDGDMQRLQEAAERSSSVGIVIRRDGQASPLALSRWRIEAAAGDSRHPVLQVTLEHCRNGRCGSWLLEWNPAVLAFRLIADLSTANPGRH
jgi:protein ImuA